MILNTYVSYNLSRFTANLCINISCIKAHIISVTIYHDIIVNTYRESFPMNVNIGFYE